MDIASLDHIKLVRGDIDQAIVEARDNLVLVEKTHRANFNSLLKCTQRYYETGIAYSTEAATAALATSGIKRKDYFRDLAKKLGRPYINSFPKREWTGRNGYSDHIMMKVPTSKPMENILGLLLIQGVKIEGSVSWWNQPLTYDNTDRYWFFYFNRKEGIQKYIQFRRMCRDNAIARIVLKLPVNLPTE